MSNNITVKDASNNNIQIHTIEDSTSAHYNMSIPINVSGLPIFTTVAPGVVSLADSVIGVSISPTQSNIPVAVATGTNLIGAVSVRQVVSVQPDGGNFPVSIAPLGFNLPVSIANSITVQGGTITASIGGAVSTQAVPVAFRDINGDARMPRTHTDGSLIVHVCNAQAAPSSDVSVSPSQGSIPVSIAGGSLAIADNAPVSVRGGILGAVSLGGGSANIGTVSISPTQANIPVSLAPPSYNLPVSVHPVTQSGTWNVGLNAGTNLVGAVSVRQIVSVQPDGTANWPVSIAPPTFNVPVSLVNPSFNLPVSVHPVTQSGTWNVGLNAGTNLVGAVSVRQIVSVQPDGTANWPVSIAPPTFNVPVSLVNPSFNIGVSIAGATGNIGVSIAAVNGNIGVSIGGTNNVGVSVRAGAVSVAGMVTVEPKSNTGTAVPAGAFFIGGTDGTTLRGMLVDALGAQIIGGAVTNAEASFTRPADTASYASGDMVANDTNKNSLTPMNFPVSKFTGGGGSISIRRARIVKSTGPITNAQFRLHLYNTSNGVTNQGVSAGTSADNAAYTATKVSNYLGFISVAMTVSHADGAGGWGMPSKGMEMNAVLPALQYNIQGLLEARAAYAPGNAERFNVTLEVFQN